MTDDRAKRFPLALADLVRGPRKATARPDAGTKTGLKPALKAISGGGLKPASAIHKAAAAAPKLVGGKTVKPANGTHSGMNASTAAEPESIALAGNTAARGVARSPAASTGDLHRSSARLHAASKPSTVVAHHQPGARRSGVRPNETRDLQPKLKTHLKPDAKAQPAKSPAPQPEVRPNAVRKAVSQTGQPSTHALTSERVRDRMVERLRANGGRMALRTPVCLPPWPRCRGICSSIPVLPRRLMRMLRCRSVIIRPSRSRRWSRG